MELNLRGVWSLLKRLPILSLMSFVMEDNRFIHITLSMIETRARNYKAGWLCETEKLLLFFMFPPFIIYKVFRY